MLPSVNLLTINPVFDRLADVWKTEPLLYDELVRRQQSVLQQIEEQEIDETIDDVNGQNPELSYNGAVLTTIHPHILFRIHDLHTAAMEGHAESMFHLSEHYRRGNGVSEDPLFAFRLVRLLAEQGFQQAFAALGRHYAFGWGTSINPAEAVRWFLQTDYDKVSGLETGV